VVDAATIASGGSLTLKVTTMAGYHINADYPLSFKPEGSSETVAFEQEKIPLQETAKKTVCADEPKDFCEAQASVPFKATKPGPAKVAGIFALSVCDPKTCLIEKVPVEAKLEVK
jgi:hypothetical protein